MQLTLPTYRFVPEDLDAGDPAALEPLFDELEARPLATAADAERWLVDESELLSRIAAETARRYIAMTCRTDDAEARERFLRMEREVAPRVKVRRDRLDRKLVESAAARELDPDRYGVLLRKRRNALEIFVEENTLLEAEEAELQTRQQELMGSITVPFEGREHTLQQMAPYLEEVDRERRRRAWEAALRARREAWGELERLFGELVELRTRMGRNAGFPGYVPYRFRQLERFDYGPGDCRRFHDAIAEAVTPAVRRLDARRRDRLGVETLRPWDLEVDLEGGEPIRPFTTQEELVELASSLFARVDPRFAEEFAILRERDLLDLMSRKGKAPGGYQYTLEDVRLPFVFANSAGTHRDVQTLLHEGGHAFHAILSRDEPLLAYRDAPIEFAETASMSMELMGLEHLAAVYGEERARRARRRHLEGVLRTLTWIASIDAFQLEIYERPESGPEDWRKTWLAIRDRFGPDVDYEGFEDARSMQWTGQGHLYTCPLYYVEYGIAQVAALQVWRRYREDPRRAVEDYRRALSLGGSRPLPELMAAAGVRFDLSAALLAELVGDVERALAE